jgi:hypothetical protein
MLFDNKNIELYKQNDTNFVASGKICQLLVIRMVRIIGIKIKIPCESWFTSLIREINDKRTEFTRDVDKCPFRINHVEVSINKFSKTAKKISYANGIFTSPTVNDFAVFELHMNDGETYELSYDSLGVNNVNKCDDIIFLGKEFGQKNQLYFNPGGSYSLPTGSLFDRDSKKYSNNH